MNRKELKKAGLRNLKEKYFLIAAICLIATLMNLDVIGRLKGNSDLTYSFVREVQDAGTAFFAKPAAEQKDPDVTNVTGGPSGLYDVVYKMAVSGKNSAQELVRQINAKETEQVSETAVLGRTRGALAYCVNSLTSGSFFVALASGFQRVLRKDKIAVIVAVFLILLVRVTIWAVFVNTFNVVRARLILEARVYEKVPLHRFMFLFRQKKLMRAAWTMFVCHIRTCLWFLTIVGGFVKNCAYFMVPYIVAENPNLKAGEAIRLSERMMDGHKWEYMKLSLSFLGWEILDIATSGVAGFVFVTPYWEAVAAEYAVYIRECAKEKDVEGTELLKDRFLYAKANRYLLDMLYEDIIIADYENDTFVDQRKGIGRFFSDNFGVIISETPEEMAFQDHQAELLRYRTFRNAAAGLAYPTRISPNPVLSEYDERPEVRYNRGYSIWTFIMIFFSMSFVGWAWEVSLHLVQDGTFVNRGVLHGPWLPIYGYGCVLILFFLYRFRRNPLMEFGTAVVLCGFLEYFSSVYLEFSHNGEKWWDYTGYFLNLNGRICAEGLLVFGVGGVAMVYFMAPNLAHLFGKINKRILIPLSLALVVIYGADTVYSGRHPNMGEGITDYEKVSDRKDEAKEAENDMEAVIETASGTDIETETGAGMPETESSSAETASDGGTE